MTEPQEYVLVSRVGSGAWGAQRLGAEPEEWFMLGADGTREEAVERASAKWPGLEMYIEDVCMECGGLGEIDDGDGPEPCAMCDGEGVYCAVWSGR